MRSARFFLLIAAAVLAGCAANEEEDPKPVVEVRVAKAELADVKITVRAPATVFARELANVGARVTAPIQALPVRKGASVAAGQLIAQLDNRDLLAQREEAAAAVADAEANLQRVSAGSLPAEIERARGQLARAQAAFGQAQKFYDRRKQLYEQGAIPQRDLLISETDLSQAKADLAVARKSLDLLENQSREKEILMAKAKLDQARARLGLVQTQLAFAEIRSPFAGTITEQFLFPGDMAKPDTPIFTVMDLSVAVARAQVPEAEAGAVRIGQACSFKPADGGGASFQGRISVVNQAVDPARRTIETWCEIPNPKRALRAGAFGQAEIITGVAPKSVVVPLPAVQFQEGTRKGTVVVAASNHTAAVKQVETGAVFENKVQILAGLQAGETVIVEGGYGLPEGTAIRVEGDKSQ